MGTANKYSAQFCHCGVIHLLPNEYYDWIQEDYRQRYIIVVCQNCGAAHKIWLDEYEEGFCICSTDLRDTELSPEDLIGCRLIFDKGIRVPIKDSMYATAYCAGTYFDDEGHNVVDTERLIWEVRDEEKLKSISAYAVPGINWKDTPYEHKI